MVASAEHGLPSYPDAQVPAPRRRLLTTKLSAPRVRPSLVARPHLVDRVIAAATPLTVVCAPAGYGKSTLVTHWLIEAGIAPAWVSSCEGIPSSADSTAISDSSNG